VKAFRADRDAFSPYVCSTEVDLGAAMGRLAVLPAAIAERRPHLFRHR